MAFVFGFTIDGSNGALLEWRRHHTRAINAIRRCFADDSQARKRVLQAAMPKSEENGHTAAKWSGRFAESLDERVLRYKLKKLAGETPGAEAEPAE